MHYQRLPGDYLCDCFILVKNDDGQVIAYKETIGGVVSYLVNKRKKVVRAIITDSRCFINIR